MPYENTTYQELVNQLGEDLGDASLVHFTQDQLTRDITESRRLWNLLTAFERTTASFLTVPGTCWYDLKSEFSSDIGYTATDVDAITLMQYRLMETLSPNIGTGATEQFPFAEYVRTLQQSRDQFLADTQCDITRRAEVSIPAGTQTYELPDTVVSVLRASWRSWDGTRHPLRPATDESTLTAMVPGWRASTGAYPKRWSVAATPNLTLRIDPAPEADGFLELMTNDTGVALDPTANSNAGTVLGIPDDLSPAPLWGALEHLLSKHGIGNDSARSQFAAQMYAVYREIGDALPLVLDISVNGVSIRTSSIVQLDCQRYGWEGRAPGRPTVAALMGNWLVLHPTPDDQYSVSVDIVRRTTVPSTSDFLPLGREQLSAILSWAKQLALFKVGGQPFAAAGASAGQLIEQARRYNETRIANSQYLIEMLSQSSYDRVDIPRSPPQGGESSEGGDPRDTASTHMTRSRNPAYRRYNHPIGGR